VCGQVAGAYYGEPGIPSPWLERLARRSEIAALADELGATTAKRPRLMLDRLGGQAPRRAP